MINVSNEYKQNIYKDTSKTVCSVSYGSFDVTAKNMAQANSSDKQSFTNEMNTLNKNINEYSKVATLELNEWLLDGSFENFPNEPKSDNFGWWSLKQSDANGNFEEAPTMTYTWQENHSSIGITLTMQNPIKKLTLKWYDANDTLLDEHIFENDDMSKKQYAIEYGVTNFKKLVLEFNQVLPHHYVKLNNIDFGIKYKWEDEIIDLKVTESIDITANTLASNELTVSLNNINNSFNKYNPSNRLRFLQEGQKLEVENSLIINGEKESVSLGTFYLTSWGSESEYTTKFVANDILLKLDRTFYHSKFYQNATVETIINDILSEIEGVSYEISEELKTITLTGYIPIVTYREALQQICFCVGAIAKTNRYNKIEIKRISNKSSCETIGYDKKEFASDKENERYSSVIVTKHTYSISSEEKEVYKGEVTGTQILLLNTPCTVTSVTGTYTSYTSYANCIEIVGASGEITVNGKEYIDYSKNIYSEIEDTSVGVTKQVLSVSNIALIGKDETATYVANWLLEQLQKYITNEFNWLGNPAIETGDTVNVQVSENLYKEAIITRNTFTYNGALSEQSEVTL